MKTNNTSRPLKLTIDGDLAAEVREVSRTIGIRPKTVVGNHLRSGLMMTGCSPEAQEYKLAMAADHLGISINTARSLRADAERRNLIRSKR